MKQTVSHTASTPKAERVMPTMRLRQGNAQSLRRKRMKPAGKNSQHADAAHSLQHP